MSVSFKLDRPHRFQVGDLVRHIDTNEYPVNVILIEDLTVRIAADGIAYPTYTISASTYGIKEFVEDVLDTEDLVRIPHIKARISSESRASRR